MTPQEQVLDAMIRRQVYLLRYAAGLTAEILRLLDMTEQDLLAKIVARATLIARRGYDTGPETTRRLRDLKASIEEIRAAAFEAIRAKLKADLPQVGQIEAGHVADAIRAAAPVDLGIALPTLREIAAVIEAKPLQGDILRNWVKRLQIEDAARIADQINIGLVQGETIDKITRRVLGSPVAKGVDGATQFTRRNATALVRTAVNHASNQGKQVLYAANADVVTREVYVATLDSRTTPLCRALDGDVYPRGEGPIPPVHWSCRSLRVPLIAERVGNRASMFGPVPAKTTYEDWLRRQSAGFQDGILGEKKGQLFRRGDLPLKRFIDERGGELTLDELRQREPAAWARAFGAAA